MSEVVEVEEGAREAEREREGGSERGVTRNSWGRGLRGENTCWRQFSLAAAIAPDGN